MAKPIRVLLYYKYLPIENAEQFAADHWECKQKDFFRCSWGSSWIKTHESAGTWHQNH